METWARWVSCDVTRFAIEQVVHIYSRYFDSRPHQGHRQRSICPRASKFVWNCPPCWSVQTMWRHFWPRENLDTKWREIQAMFHWISHSYVSIKTYFLTYYTTKGFNSSAFWASRRPPPRGRKKRSVADSGKWARRRLACSRLSDDGKTKKRKSQPGETGTGARGGIGSLEQARFTRPIPTRSLKLIARCARSSALSARTGSRRAEPASLNFVCDVWAQPTRPRRLCLILARDSPITNENAASSDSTFPSTSTSPAIRWTNGPGKRRCEQLLRCAL